MTALTRFELCVIAVLTSTFGLLLEQIFVRNLAMAISEVLPAQTVSLIFYLAGLGAGSFLSDYFSDQRARRALVPMGFALSAIGFLGIPFAQALYFVFKFFIHEYSQDIVGEIVKSKRGILFASQLVPLSLGVLSGLEISFLVRFGAEVDSQRGSSFVLGANYAGAVIASVLFTSWLILLPPYLSALVTASGGALVYSWLAWRMRREPSRRWLASVAFGAVLMLAYASAISFYSQYEQLALKARYASGYQLFTWRIIPRFLKEDLLPRPDGARLFTRYQVADFMPLSPRGVTFFLDGHPQLDPEWSDDYHNSLIRAPIQFYRQIPKRVLILGGGDGIAAGEVLRYGEAVDKVTLVELDERILRMARELPYFTALNRGALDNKKVEARAADAIEFLRQTRGQYDMIVADFPLPFDYDLLKLFSVEFYTLVRQRLAPDGFFVFDSGIRRPDWPGGTHREWNAVLLSTLKAAGFRNVVPYRGNEVFIAARLDARRPDAGPWEGVKIEMLTLDSMTAEELPGGVNSIFKPHLHKLESLDF